MTLKRLLVRRSVVKEPSCLRQIQVLWASVAFALSAPLQAQSSAEPPSTPQPAELATRFDPPLGRTLRYKVTQQKGPADKAQTIAMLQEVTYRRDGTAFVMAITTTALTSGDRTIVLGEANAPVPVALRPLLDPIELDVDSDGTIVRARGWDAYRERMKAALPGLVAESEPDPVKRKAVEAGMAKFFEQFLTATPEQAPHRMLRGWPDLLGLMGASGPEGEDLSFESEVAVPFRAEPLRLEVTVRLTKPHPGDTLMVSAKSSPDEEDFRNLVKAVLASVAQSMPGDKQVAQNEVERVLAGMELTTLLTVELDPTTGVLRRGVVDRNVTTGQETRLNRITIEAM